MSDSNISIMKRLRSSITAKFALAGGLMLFLIVTVAATGYFSLSYVRMAETNIKVSTDIQRLVLEMDRELEEARRLHGDFFLHYPEMGLAKAHETYAQPAIRQVAQAIKTSEQLIRMIEMTPVSEGLKQKKVDMNLFFSSAKRFAGTSIRSFELVTERVAPDRGIEPRLDRAMNELYQKIQLFQNLRRSFRDVQKYVLEYKVDRQRYHMQSAFNAIKALMENLRLVPFFSPEELKDIEADVKRCREYANELLAVDSEIKSILNDFALQDNAMDTIADSLVALSMKEVEKKRSAIDRAYQMAMWIMLGITLLGLFLALMAVRGMNIGITQKLVAMTQRAAELRMGNLNISVDEGSADELGELGRTFNIMARRMRDLVDHLEDMVEQRTFQLEESNRKLQQEISERIQAEEDKERLENQLRQAHKMEAIGTLAGGIAHDFNNILAAILGYAEMAMDDIPAWNPARYALTEVLTASHRAKDLVKQILAFSRKSQQGKSPVNITTVIDGAMKLLRASIPTTIDIRQDIQAEPTVLADPTQIHQVIVNLCTNAAQAMDVKGGVLTVSLKNMVLEAGDLDAEEGMAPGTYTVLTVSDTGEGIDEAIIGRIFDPYFTTKDVGKGSGMGLSVVHGIVKSHQGMVRVKSEKNVGTSVTVYLPVIGHEADRPTEITGVIPGGTEHILVVDDEPAMAEIHSKRLQSLGYKVTTITESLKALDYFKAMKDEVALVLTDQTMPQLTGEQLSLELMRIRPDIPIIISTGYSSKMDEGKARDMGVKAFLMKPIDKPILSKTIRDILDHQGEPDTSQ